MTDETKKSVEPKPPEKLPAGPVPPRPPSSSSLIASPNGADLAPMGERGIILRTFEELRRFAKLCVDSGAAPKGMTAGGAAVAIQLGLERGLGPLGGLQFCTVINGQLSWKAQGASALIRNSPVCKRGSFNAWVEGEGDDRKGVAVAHRLGYKEPTRVEFFVRDAKKADLWNKDNWKKYPDRQLKARAIGFLARDDYSDVLGGFPLAEEAIDFDDDRRPPAETVTASSSAASGPPPMPSGPDPVLEALEKAPAVIEVETTEAEEMDQAVAVPAYGEGVKLFDRAELEAHQVERPPDPPSVEVEKPEGKNEGSLRSKLGIQVSGPPPAEELAEVLEDETPTPPRGIPAITDEELERNAHLEADAELAAQEDQVELFSNKEGNNHER